MDSDSIREVELALFQSWRAWQGLKGIAFLMENPASEEARDWDSDEVVNKVATALEILAEHGTNAADRGMELAGLMDRKVG